MWQTRCTAIPHMSSCCLQSLSGAEQDAGHRTTATRKFVSHLISVIFATDKLNGILNSFDGPNRAEKISSLHTAIFTAFWRAEILFITSVRSQIALSQACLDGRLEIVRLLRSTAFSRYHRERSRCKCQVD
ncbi:uncharacterized protein PHALS_11140 [Plasmopara halstedii]|uniref:Uncharacterized protein n=1 Tax=Plasmopara halstedii TaxID=4781 RepID=A0A0P1AJH8_PLAHL|nr:uncharacterized protein PHALS_11140 [Plasmopara halstedii]CEG40967.1 hypothetical protein PHALS_11140 [Plasmopara halstedii]|eukprot:XP_024577336.1 hypothetical protein PHALS_11140 [Plasmopara halstedii]